MHAIGSLKITCPPKDSQWHQCQIVECTIASASKPAATHIGIEIYDLNGMLIIPLVNQTQAAGTYNIWWHGHDRSGRMVKDGVYICRIRAGEFTKSKTILLYR